MNTKDLQSLLPFDEVVSITPSDSTRFDAYDALYVAKECTIKIQVTYGTPVSIPVPIAPQVLPFRVVKVFATGTVADDASTMVGFIFGCNKKRHIDSREKGQVT